MKKLCVIASLMLFVVLGQAQDLKPSKDKSTKKYGYVNKAKEWVIEAQFDKAKKFDEGIAEVIMDDKVGLINETGTYITEPKYDNIASFKDGFAEVKLDKKIGIIGNTGKEIIAPKYDKIDKFINHIAIVELDKKEGLVSDEGKEILVPTFDKINDFKEGIAIVENGENKGIVQENGKVILDAKYIEVEKKNDFIYAQNTMGWGIFKSDGAVLFEPQFIDKPNFNSTGISTVAINGKVGGSTMKKYGIISSDGTYKLACDHLTLDEEDGWYFAIHVEKGWMVYNSDFSILRDNIDALQKCNRNYFNNGICAYKQNGKWGFVNKNFETVVPFNFDNIHYDGFKNGYCAVEVDSKWGFINPDGSYKFKPKYTEIASGFMNVAGTKAALVWIGKKKYSLAEDGSQKLLEDHTPAPAAAPTAGKSASTLTTATKSTAANNNWILGKWTVYEEKVGVVRKGTKCQTRYYNFTSKNSVTVNKFESHSYKYKDEQKSYSISNGTLTIGTLKLRMVSISADKKSMTLSGPLGTYWKVRK